MEDDYSISTKVFACGHEAFVPVPKDKWEESFEKPVHHACKCDNCDFPKLLLKFRHFNNPSNKLCLSRTTRLAFEMFDSRFTLSVENMDALMRHWMRAIQCQIFEESKHRALFDCLAESVADQDGAMAGKQMKALLESGYLRFIKNGRGYSRPVARKRANMKIPTMESLSRPGSSAASTITGPTSVTSGMPSAQMGNAPISPPTSPGSAFTASSSHFKDSIGGIDSRMTAAEWMALEQQYAAEEEAQEEEDAARLRSALERLHNAVEFLGWPAEDWGNRPAQTEIIDKYCDDLERPPVTLAEKALHYRFVPKDKRGGDSSAKPSSATAAEGQDQRDDKEAAVAEDKENPDSEGRKKS